MELTNRQKVYICVLALALAVLVVDRVFLASEGAGPDQAQAEMTNSTDADVLSDIALRSLSSRQSESQRSLAERLEALAKSRQLDVADARDAFALSESWKAVYVPISSGRSALTSAQKFAQVHKLKAVTVGDGVASAVVDDDCIRVGQVLDGFELVSVDVYSATFESNAGQRVVLRLGGSR